MSPRTVSLSAEQTSAENDLKAAFIVGLCETIEAVTGLGPEEVTLKKNFVDDLDIDSLSIVEMSIHAEDAYGIAIPDYDLAGLRTVGELQCYLLETVRDNPQAMINLARTHDRTDLVEAIRQYTGHSCPT